MKWEEKRDAIEKLEHEYNESKLAICEVLFSKHIYREQTRLRRLAEKIADMSMINGELAQLMKPQTDD